MTDTKQDAEALKKDVENEAHPIVKELWEYTEADLGEALIFIIEEWQKIEAKLD